MLLCFCWVHLTIQVPERTVREPCQFLSWVFCVLPGLLRLLCSLPMSWESQVRPELSSHQCRNRLREWNCCAQEHFGDCSKTSTQDPWLPSISVCTPISRHVFTSASPIGVILITCILTMALLPHLALWFTRFLSDANPLLSLLSLCNVKCAPGHVGLGIRTPRPGRVCFSLWLRHLASFYLPRHLQIEANSAFSVYLEGCC